ncbi:unnamed protein product [Lathyrus oleraceus]|uniref:non-specific serine/threonine protein kinase n=2 Tax=Pisum sativum TaxID=3888 RepID=A0A9D4WRJ7_PEA|nr:CBL-interacting protein kinase 2-like isoform X2 [Pisum sativum]XP_050880415.1 CBL-interacting protein kinase 2-like isoform X2 [Pisum sativum]KAI5407788.1 hypothetical protein KIW84_053863 [Pisum sativum]
MENIKDIIVYASGVNPEMEKTGKVLMSKYEFGKLLGQGNFAKVYLARDLRTGDNVAIKVIDKEKVLKLGFEVQTRREVLTMRQVKHPNILRLYEVSATKTKIYLIIEYAKGGELFEKIEKGRLCENQARKYFQQLIKALDFCHKQGVYHRDLKPENLLLDENGDLKIADFGMSTFLEAHQRNSLLKTACGTPAYVAPEVVCRKGYYGAKSDVWSCGVILYTLLAGYLPFYDNNLMVLYGKIYRGEYSCPNWFPLDIRRLLARILDPNPNKRITTAKIMENPWFRRGLYPKAVQMKKEITDVADDETAAVKPTQALAQPTYLNAFYILSLSAGLDLSVLFATDNSEKEDFKFTSMSSPSSIVATIEDVACILQMEIVKTDGGMLKLEWPRERREEPLIISAEIFEFAPSFYLVEMKKSCGDALEYQKIMMGHIRPALKDIVWIWQGEK